MFSLFGSGKLKKALQRGATIVDVRTVHEYDQGRLRGSINIPMDRISSSVERIRNMGSPVIFCANGDGRSGKAARFMRSQGLKDVYDAGNWEKLVRLL